MTLQRRVLAYLALAAIASCALTVAVAVVLVRNKVAAQRITTLENQADVLEILKRQGLRNLAYHRDLWAKNPDYRYDVEPRRVESPMAAADSEAATDAWGEELGAHRFRDIGEVAVAQIAIELFLFVVGDVGKHAEGETFSADDG